MRMQWKPDKAPKRKREQKQRLARQQKRKDFAENMQRAEALSREYYNAAYPSDVCPGDLAQEFASWAFCKYRHDKFNEPLTKLHQDMDENWREIVLTAEACAKASAARIEAKNKQMKSRHATAMHVQRVHEITMRALR